MSAGPAGSLRPRTSGPAPARPGAGAPRPGDGQGEGRPAALTLPTPAGRPPEGAPAGPGPGPGPPGRDSGPRRHPRAPRRPRSRRARPAGPRLGTPLFVSVTSGTSGRPSAPGGWARAQAGRPGVGTISHRPASSRGICPSTTQRVPASTPRTAQRPQRRPHGILDVWLHSPHPSWTGCPPEPPAQPPRSPRPVFGLFPSYCPTSSPSCRCARRCCLLHVCGRGGALERTPLQIHASLGCQVRFIHPRHCGLVKVYSNKKMDQEGLDAHPQTVQEGCSWPGGCRKPGGHVLSACCAGGGVGTCPCARRCLCLGTMWARLNPPLRAIPCPGRALEDAQEMGQNPEAKLGFCPSRFCVWGAPDPNPPQGKREGMGMGPQLRAGSSPHSLSQASRSVPRETLWTVLGAR